MIFVQRTWMLFSSLLVLLVLAPPAEAVMISGRTTATFTWSAASGDVHGYVVYVARNGEPLPGTLESWTAANTRLVTVEAQPSESVVVTVAALDARLRPGPRSQPSETVWFAGCNAGGPDSDGDGWADACDNCPYEPNPSQSDRGGLGQSAVPDGIGDACQCGDVSGDGTITSLDYMLVYLSIWENNPARMPRRDLCDVGDTLGCTVLDGYILQWALDDVTTIVPQCGPARP